MAAKARVATIHGHEVIRLINQAARPFTRKTLAAEVARRFGPQARFHTCSDDNMSLDELLAFLAARGKVIEENGTLSVELSRVCENED